MSSPTLRPALSTAVGDQVERGAVVGEVGREAALVAEASGKAVLLQHALERVVDLGALLERLAEGRRPDGRDHELLHVDAGVGVGAAVEDVHHRHREHVGIRPTDVSEERQAGGVRRGPRHRERDTEDRVGPELGLVGRAVQVEQALVDQPLLGRLEARRAPGRSRRGPRRRPSRLPCPGSGRPRRAAPPPRTHPWRRRTGRPHDRWCRRRGRPRPRRWGCRGSRGSRGRRRLRWWPLVLLGREGSRGRTSPA